MGKIGYGYGSEWHLLRWMGRHRKKLSTRVLDVLGLTDANIEWLDTPFSTKKTRLKRDLEYVGLNFLIDSHPAQAAWRNFWPQSGNAHNWDAVGQIRTQSGEIQWLLVEAKAHTGELISNCGASLKGGLGLISNRLDDVKMTLGVSKNANWLKRHYQYANRIAFLHFLKSQGVKAQLLFIYFCGDDNDSVICPTDKSGWDTALHEQDVHLGLPKSHAYSNSIYKLFLDV